MKEELTLSEELENIFTNYAYSELRIGDRNSTGGATVIRKGILPKQVLQAISKDVLTLFNKRIDDSKEEIAASIYDWLPTTSWLKNISDVDTKAQDIINIIKKEVGK